MHEILKDVANVKNIAPLLDGDINRLYFSSLKALPKLGSIAQTAALF